MITANEARKLTDALDISQHTAFLSVEIHNAAKQGLSWIEFYKQPYQTMAATHADEAMRRTTLALQNHGFKVEYIQSTDQREPSCTRVSW